MALLFVCSMNGSVFVSKSVCVSADLYYYWEGNRRDRDRYRGIVLMIDIRID